MKHKKNAPKLSGQAAVDYIKKKLGYKTYAEPPKHWLNTGDEYCNKVLGSKKLGVAYGKLLLRAGQPSSGKSAIAAWLVGLAQADGAEAAWVDGENSWDPQHVSHQGVDPDKVAVFRPEYGEFGYKKKKDKRVIKEEVEAAEDVFNRVEIWMKLQRKQNPDGKLIVVVDSTTSFAPEEELMAGLQDQNMRTKVSPAVFLNNVSKRWIGLALHTNALVILISQLRTNPGQMFGEKDYVPGGKGLGFYSSVVVWMRRVKGGEILRHGRQIGVKGLMSNKKNKAGGGSIERKKCGYASHFYKNKWQFIDAKKIKKEIDNGE